MSQKHILIVDDTQEIPLITGQILASLGYAVTSASTGQEALAMAHQTRFDLALVDYQMPSPDGLEVLTRLRHLQPHCARILMSGLLDLAVTLQAVNCGEAARILQKPFTSADLVDAIDEAFDMQRRLGLQYHALTEDSVPYQLLIEHTNDAIIVLQHNQVIYQNTAHISMLGYSTEELTQQHFLSFVAPEDHQFVSEYYQKRLRGEPVPQQYTVELISRAGKRLTAEVKPRIITHQGQLATLLVTRDITQQRQAEQAFQKAHQRTNQLLGAIPSLLIGLDTNATVVWWNTIAEELLGRPATEVIGQPLSACGISWDDGLILQALTTCQRTGQGVRLDNLSFQYPDGSTGYLGIGISPIPTRKDEELCLLLMGQDITSRRQLESQLGRAQKLEAIGQLAAGIAHEINTPTQYIGDNIRFLQDAFHDLTELLEHYDLLRAAIKAGPLPVSLLQQVDSTVERMDVTYLVEEIPQAIQQAIEGTERVAKIVQAMKDFSHPGTEHKTAIDLNRAVESTITVARNEWKYIAEMVLDLDPASPPIACFPGELNQVILNLIVNAAHSIADALPTRDEPKGLITVQTRQKDNWLTLCVTDTGMGIPATIRDKIFDPFFTTKEVGKGTGQGLAIAYDVIVRKHGGTITFDTVEGQGTTFIIRLPLEESNP